MIANERMLLILNQARVCLENHDVDAAQRYMTEWRSIRRAMEMKRVSTEDPLARAMASLLDELYAAMGRKA